MKVLNLSIIVLLSLIFFSNVNATQLEGDVFSKEQPTLTTEQEANEPPQLMVVKFHADWCGSCRALGPAITDLSNKLDGESVLFTELDFTNLTRKHQTLLLASALGIAEIVEQNKGTGFILVIDSKTKEVKAKLTKTQSVKEMSKIISDIL